MLILSHDVLISSNLIFLDVQQFNYILTWLYTLIKMTVAIRPAVGLKVLQPSPFVYTVNH